MSGKKRLSNKRFASSAKAERPVSEVKVPAARKMTDLVQQMSKRRKA